MKRYTAVAPFVFLVTLVTLGFLRGRLTAQPEAPPAEEPAPETIVEFVEVAKLGLTVPCRVLSVHDGDTLKVECRFVMDIRLLDCWAPEIHGPEKEAGIRSREHLKKLAEGKPGVVHIPLTDANIGKATTMGRVLGKVIVNGDDLSYEQVKKKMATKEKPKD